MSALNNNPIHRAHATLNSAMHVFSPWTIRHLRHHTLTPACCFILFYDITGSRCRNMCIDVLPFVFPSQCRILHKLLLRREYYFYYAWHCLLPVISSTVLYSCGFAIVVATAASYESLSKIHTHTQTHTHSPFMF